MISLRGRGSILLVVILISDLSYRYLIFLLAVLRGVSGTLKLIFPPTLQISLFLRGTWVSVKVL